MDDLDDGNLAPPITKASAKKKKVELNFSKTGILQLDSSQDNSQVSDDFKLKNSQPVQNMNIVVKNNTVVKQSKEGEVVRQITMKSETIIVKVPTTKESSQKNIASVKKSVTGKALPSGQ